MCGIVGIYDRSGAPVARELLDRMTGALVHRGPDGEGSLLDGEAGLGHRRLSIIDLEGGAQPIGNEDGSVQVVFNGEIYNFEALRSELEGLGHRFRTQSDTETIVHAYEEWGVDCPNHLNGMFAFALWDRRRRSLFIARDHLGIKPLYYTTLGRQLVFASEVKSLMQHPAFASRVDLQALAELFTFRCVPAPRSLLEGVFKLPPGHSMEATAGATQIRRYWRVIPAPLEHVDEAELIERYRALLSDAVRLQLRSDVPLGLFLSSGIDSGVLLALMAQGAGPPVDAFTIDFEDGADTSESADAQTIAARFGARHHRMTVSAADYRGYFERCMGDLEEPVGHEAAPAFYFVAKLASGSVKVALTGQGADEPWAGYRRHLGVHWSGLYSRLPPVCSEAIGHAVRRLPIAAERLKRGVTALGERDVLTRFVKVHSFFSADLKAALYRNELKASFDRSPFAAASAIRDLQHEVRHLDPLSQMLYIDTRTNLPDDLLMVGDKTSMANSLELRVPFLDRRLVEFVETLPSRFKLRGLTGKYLHKKALLKWLPREAVYRKKKGFDTPVGRWLRTSLRPLVEEHLLSSDSRTARYFEPAGIRRMLELDRAGVERYTRHIWLLLSLEMWHRAFIAQD